MRAHSTVDGGAPPLNCDLCVIGGGLAGLAAATRAAELGLGVVLLEQGDNNRYPCNSRYAGGMLHLAFMDVASAPDALSGRLAAKCPADLDRALIETIGRNSARTLRWLRGVGRARFVRAGAAEWMRWCLAPIRPNRAGLAWPGRGADVLLRGLTGSFLTFGGRLVLGARAENVRLSTSSGFVIDFNRRGAADSVTARSVALCDGGFQADRLRVGAHIATAGATLLDRHAGTARGFALYIAERLDLRVVGLETFYGHLMSVDSLTNLRLWPWPTLDDLAVAGILVDETGSRLGSDGDGGVFLANVVGRRSAGARSFVVIDEEIWQRVGRRTRVLPCNPLLRTIGATMHSGNDLTMLAAAAGIDPAGLMATLAAAKVSAPDAPRGQPRSPPFHIIPTCAGITNTLGGIAVDAGAAAVTADGRPFPGLFAAGGSIGGAEGGAGAFYLGGLAKAAITGMLAGENAAAYVQSGQTRVGA